MSASRSSSHPRLSSRTSQSARRELLDLPAWAAPAQGKGVSRGLAVWLQPGLPWPRGRESLEGLQFGWRAGMGRPPIRGLSACTDTVVTAGITVYLTARDFSQTSVLNTKPHKHYSGLGTDLID